jgi:hypothetical protein
LSQSPIAIPRWEAQGGCGRLEGRRRNQEVER